MNKMEFLYSYYSLQIELNYDQRLSWGEQGVIVEIEWARGRSHAAIEQTSEEDFVYIGILIECIIYLT